MLVLLLESEYNCINSVVDFLTAKYDKKSVVKIDSKRVDKDVIADLSHKPLLDNGWLVICSSKVPVAAVKAINKVYNNVVIKVTSYSQLVSVQESLANVEYQFIDNYVLEEETVKEWIKDKLQCRKSDAALIYSRCGKKLRYIVSAVDTLHLLDDVDAYAICKYIEKVNTVSVADITLYLLGIQQDAVSEKEVLKTVSQFRYAYKWLLNTIETELLTYQKIYEFIARGELSLQNYRSFRETCSDKKITGISEYKLKQIINSFSDVSMEYLFYLCNYLERIPRQYFSIYKLVYLIKIVGRIR